MIKHEIAGWVFLLICFLIWRKGDEIQETKFGWVAWIAYMFCAGNGVAQLGQGLWVHKLGDAHIPYFLGGLAFLVVLIFLLQLWKLQKQSKLTDKKAQKYLEKRYTYGTK